MDIIILFMRYLYISNFGFISLALQNDKYISLIYLVISSFFKRFSYNQNGYIFNSLKY